MSFNDANFYGRGPNNYIQLKIDGKINTEFEINMINLPIMELEQDM
jgi:hypothetical protein